MATVFPGIVSIFDDARSAFLGELRRLLRRLIAQRLPRDAISKFALLAFLRIAATNIVVNIPHGQKSVDDAHLAYDPDRRSQQCKAYVRALECVIAFVIKMDGSSFDRLTTKKNVATRMYAEETQMRL